VQRALAVETERTAELFQRAQQEHGAELQTMEGRAASEVERVRSVAQAEVAAVKAAKQAADEAAAELQGALARHAASLGRVSHARDEAEGRAADVEARLAAEASDAASLRQELSLLRSEMDDAAAVGEDAVRQAELFKRETKRLAQRLRASEDATRHIAAAQEAAEAAQRALAAERAATVAANEAATRSHRRAAELEARLTRQDELLRAKEAAEAEAEALRTRLAGLRRSSGLSQRAAAFDRRQSHELLRVAERRAHEGESPELQDALDDARALLGDGDDGASGAADALARLVLAVEADGIGVTEAVLEAERRGIALGTLASPGGGRGSSGHGARGESVLTDFSGGGGPDEGRRGRRSHSAAPVWSPPSGHGDQREHHQSPDPAGPLAGHGPRSRSSEGTGRDRSPWHDVTSRGAAGPRPDRRAGSLAPPVSPGEAASAAELESSGEAQDAAIHSASADLLAAARRALDPSNAAARRALARRPDIERGLRLAVATPRRTAPEPPAPGSERSDSVPLSGSPPPRQRRAADAAPAVPNRAPEPPRLAVPRPVRPPGIGMRSARSSPEQDLLASMIDDDSSSEPPTPPLPAAPPTRAHPASALPGAASPGGDRTLFSSSGRMRPDRVEALLRAAHDADARQSAPHSPARDVVVSPSLAGQWGAAFRQSVSSAARRQAGAQLRR